MQLKGFSDYGLGNTPVRQVNFYCPSNNLYLKLESTNPTGSIKARTAYYIVKDLITSGKLKHGVHLVESSSGNLGLAIAHFAREIGIRFLCLVDPTIAPKKLKELEEFGVELHMVSLGANPDYRSARICMAQDLDKREDWIWTNQYDNPSNFKAHYETTGPEIWSQLNGQIDYFVCSVGTGGTICGIGHLLKEQNPNVKVVAVEPLGSTIFGGKPSSYLGVGAGMRCPSGIFRTYGEIIDCYCKINDGDAIQECKNILYAEGISVGITSGSVLVVASYLAEQHPQKSIVAVSPDGGEKYMDLLSSDKRVNVERPPITLLKYNPTKKVLE